MSNNPKHLWLATVRIVYAIPADEEKKLRAGQGTIETNVIIDTPMKKLTAKHLSQIQEISLMKLQEQNNLDPSWLSDFVILSFNYLGLMSLNEYLGKDKD
jgi:hypothetical protein